MAKTRFTPRPWNLIWYGNEQYPYPLSILADEDGAWIARGGFVSSKANADLLDAAPDLYAALEVLGDHARHVAANADEWNDKDTVSIQISIGELRRAVVALAKARGEA